MTEMTSYLGWKIDFSRPAGEPALFAPDSLQWRIYKNPVALAVGGVAAVLLEFADARIRSGVWDHSVYKADPIGRSRRTAVAALVGVYGPASAARRVIQGVTNMHAKVSGTTPDGEPYHALDPELLDWVAATASYGFLVAYDRFVAPLCEAEKGRYWRAGGELGALYGVRRSPASTAEFMAMTEALAPRFEPHPIVDEFLAIIQSGRAAPGTPKFLHRALARAAIAIVPPLVRDKLQLGKAYDLTSLDSLSIRMAAAVAERRIDPRAAPCQASVRLGLPADFLYRGPGEQRRLIAQARPGGGSAATAA